jgi:hypothetical protein
MDRVEISRLLGSQRAQVQLVNIACEIQEGTRPQGLCLASPSRQERVITGNLVCIYQDVTSRTFYPWSSYLSPDTSVTREDDNHTLTGYSLPAEPLQRCSPATQGTDQQTFRIRVVGSGTSRSDLTFLPTTGTLFAESPSA